MLKTQWLEKEFLKYIDDWDSEIQKTDFEPKEKAKMGLSAETVEGLRITGKNMYLLQWTSSNVCIY